MGPLPNSSSRLAAVCHRFEIPGECVEAEPCGSGHIHDTFVCRSHLRGAGGEERRFVVQRLNTRIFTDPGALMENVARICAHLAAKVSGGPDAERRALSLVPARDGRPYHIDEDGDWWRVFPFVEGSTSVDFVSSPAEAFEAGRAFGDFAVQLADLPAPPLAVTLPGFHDLDARFAAFETALREDPISRAASVRNEAETARRLVETLRRALDRARTSELPTRIVHNDCKINNLLLDEVTREGLCVIDLDTVMEGRVVSDFGELVRTSSTRAPEDERNLAAIRVEASLLDALVRGYVGSTRGWLDDRELLALPLAGPILALENAVRFLADHLRGDVYFHTARVGHNRDRGRAQLRLAEMLVARRDAVRDAVDRVFSAAEL